MSVEALAMGGVDYKERAINHCESQGGLTPPQAKSQTDDLSLGTHRVINNNNSCVYSSKLFPYDEWVKLKMREWARAVASNNETKANLKVSEIFLIMDHHRHIRGN
ncbi:hypothetical protein MtrunA17_Chr3g0123921 [Medicago truncatula]|uniref:Uncharacterized protein n=1 Tax=Medicago truncatula TaxID=3880 RepID=G7J3Q7_MEDTR|nr:hypothetical protein MTR_3g087090 [Medicago truncatula]RHN69367.1 hypothetical protein MtrunA17_Chr3g0123921 [Medicago truncatula]